MIAAALGRDRLTKGDDANRWRSKETPRSPSKSLKDHDIASNRAEPVSLLISLLATYFRCDDLVDPTNQPISFTYLRHVLDEPSHVGTPESRSFEFISYRRAHSGAYGAGSGAPRSATNSGSTPKN